MNLQYVERALCFHGAPLQKIWDNERGADDLQRLGVPVQPNYEIYQQRQRFFTFQDRAKRLKLHQFFARKAKDLYDTDLKKYANLPDDKLLEKVRSSFVTMPTYEYFACDPQDKDRKYQAVLESFKPGDVIYAMVCNSSTNYAMVCNSSTRNKSVCNSTTRNKFVVKPLCTAEPTVRYLNHLPIKGFVCLEDLGKLPLDENGQPRDYQPSDIVRCEFLRGSIEVDRIFVGFNNAYLQNVELGLVKRDELPFYYDKTRDCTVLSYGDHLKESKEFLNPNYEVLYTMNGLDINDTFSMMGALKLPFPPHEMAKELRKAQAHKWAFRSVAEGIELFKNGHHLEAFQCLNKALSIDPYNVEGLVARGALFANRGSFHKAVDDFGNALKLDKFHANARKYMGETLVALGRSLEEDKRLDEAAKAYKDCLELIPQHVQALGCLDALNQRLTGSLLDTAFFDNLLNIPAATTLKPPPDFDMSNDEPLKATNSSSSSGDSSTGSESSSDSDDSAAKGESEKFQKTASLSPLSKRMALHAASMRGVDATAGIMNNKEVPPPPPKIPPIRYDQPFFAARAATTTNVADANDFRLDDDDTQSRVLSLLQQATAHKKDKKKKTKKSKSKKSKKDSRKSKKSEKDVVSQETKQSLFQSNYLLETFKNIGNDNFQNKLSKDINSYEHKIAEIQKKQEQLRQSLTLGKPGAPNFDETPPPPPSMHLQPAQMGKINVNLSKAKGVATSQQTTTSLTTASTASSAAGSDGNRFSFQIKKAVKVDKFGLVRIATPLAQRSPSPTRDIRNDRADSRRGGRSSRSRTRSPQRRRRRGGRNSRSRTRSPQRRRRRSSKSRSRSRSRRRSRSLSYRRRSRSRSRSSHRSRRRNSRDTRSRHRNSRSPYLRRRSRSRSNERNYKKSDRTVSRATRSPKFMPKSNFGNRVWQRPGYSEPPPPGVGDEPKSSDQRWLHDKFEEINSDRPPAKAPAAKEEGPSIEEIDEIIKKAQKERKEEIIKRDNDILKRPNIGRF